MEYLNKINYLLLPWLGNFIRRDTGMQSGQSPEKEMISSSFDNLPSHVAILDDTGEIIAVNKAWRKFADENGLNDPDYWVGKSYIAVCEKAAREGNEDGRRAADGIREVIAGANEEFTLGYTCHSKEENRWFQAKVRKAPGIVVVAHENISSVVSSEVVTEGQAQREIYEKECELARKKSELAEKDLALGESEKRFRQLVEDSLAGTYIFQGERLVYVNDSLARISGYTKKDLLAMSSLVELIHPEDVSTLKAKVQEMIEGRINHYYKEFRIIRKDGSVINLEDICWMTEYGSKPAIAGTVVDITERKNSEEERSSVFSMLSHDIKSPLTVILGYCDILEATLKDENDLEMVQSIKKSCGKIQKLVSDILELPKLKAGAPLNIEPLSLAELLKQIINENEQAIKKMDLSIGLEIPEDLPEVKADKRKVARALENLLLNAIKYNKDGGSVRLRAGIDAAGENIFIEVADTGLGIPQEDLGHLFERFYRGKEIRKRPGTGLGLAVVKAIADAHGGRVEVESAVDKGSTFRFFIPLNIAGNRMAA
jgi:PAS domain S-box-containing protein